MVYEAKKDQRTFKKDIPQKKKTLGNQILPQRSNQRNKHPGILLVTLDSS